MNRRRLNGWPQARTPLRGVDNRKDGQKLRCVECHGIGRMTHDAAQAPWLQQRVTPALGYPG